MRSTTAIVREICLQRYVCSCLITLGRVPRRQMGQHLEATIRALIDRRNAVPEDSAEYNEIVRQLGELYDNDHRAGLIAEEYNSLLATLVGTIDLE